MSRNEDINNGIWSDPDFEELSLEATALYIWSWTNPRCGMAGLYKVSKRAMTESKVPADRIDAALDELASAGFAFHEEGVLFVRSRVKHLRQKTPQIAKSISRDVAKIPRSHPLRAKFLEEYGWHPWLSGHLEREGPPSVTGGSGESQAVPPLGGSPGVSVEGPSTLQGNGNGNGKGNGPQGRGLGRGEAEQLAESIGVPKGYGDHYWRQIKSRDGVKPTAEELLPLLEQHRPAEGTA